MADFRRIAHLGLRRAKSVAADLDDEIAFHLQERIDALVAQGWSVDDATAEARRRFGDPADVRPALLATATMRNRRLDWLEQIDAVVDDLKLAARQLRHAPALAVGVIAAIALGIGANATMFSVIDRLMLRPPAGVASPERVFTIAHPGRPRFSSAISYPALSALRDHLAKVATIAAESYRLPLPVSFGAESRPERSVFVDDAYFRVLGARPALGRLFASDDVKSPDGAPVVIISYALWQREFARDSGVIGRELAVGDQRLNIIGVGARDFNGVETEPFDLWLPITLAPKLVFAPPHWETDKQPWLFPVVRLESRIDPKVVAQRATTVARAFERTLPKGDTTITTELHSILPSQAPILSPEAKIAALLGAVSLLVLVVACLNAANLMLARALRREREIAIRVALGVSRRRLIRQLLIDSLLLSVLGGIAAVAVAAAGSTIMRRVLLQGLVWSGDLIDVRTLGFIAIVSLGAALVTCVFPALLLVRRFDIARALSNGSSRQAGRTHRSGFVSLLVVAQTSLSALLLIGALLFVRSLENVRRVPLGIDVHHTAIAWLDPKRVRDDDSTGDALFTELAARASRIPGVTHVAIAEGASFTVYQVRKIAVPGMSPELDAIKNGTMQRAVSADYFAAMGTRIVQGRGFTAAEDRGDGEPLAIINASMATMLWPNGDALAHCIQVAGRDPETARCRRIIGIAEDGRVEQVTNTDIRESACVYLPLSQGGHRIQSRAVIVRTAAEDEAITRKLRIAARTGTFVIPLFDVFTLQSKLDPELRPWKLGAAMFGMFGILALLLAALGTYSVIAYSVAQRTQEMGVRIALGARTMDILALIGRQGARLAVIGVVIAAIAGASVAPLIQPLLFQTSARSGITYAVVGVVMLIVALGASLIPAWRGARVDPLTAIRTE